ncbi:MAG: hypothetical protein V1929_03825 [bacterium]
MKTPRTVSPVQAMALLGRGVLLEIARRKDLYVLFMLMGVFVLGVLAVDAVGIENASTATFLLNLGLTLAYVASHALTLFLAARQIPDDLENRTIYPLLARPVSRDVYVLGKWLACVLTGVGVFAALFLLGWAPAPKMEFYSTPLLAQLLALQAVSIATLASMTICLSIFAPRALAVVLIGGWALAGSTATAFLLNGMANPSTRAAARWLFGYLPDFARLNLITRYTDGIAALALPQFAGLLAYGLIFTAFGLTLAMARFRRMVL